MEREETLENEQRVGKLLETQAQLKVEQHHIQELVQHFSALTTYDVVLRHAQQLSRLAAAEGQLAAANQPDSTSAKPPVSPSTLTSAEQLQRNQRALTEQLKEVHRAIVDSLTLVRHETHGRLQQHAMQLGQQIEAAERFSAMTANQESSAELARSLAQQLDQLRTFSRLDANLPAAVKIAQRRLSELALPTQRTLDELSDSLARRLPSENKVNASIEQLARQRELQRAAPRGDRLYASDLGAAQRALEALDIATNSDSQTLTQSVRDIATAIEALQAIHRVTEIDLLLADLLKAERVDEPTHELAWSGPRAWDVIEQRFEQAVKSLSAAEVSQNIVQGLEQLRNGNSAKQSAQKMNRRLWQAEAPQSTVAELENLRAELNRWRNQLAEIAQAARRTLTERGPKISELAQQAAEEIRDVEQQSTQLAESLDRREVPDLEVRLEQLANQTDALQSPIERLREALVDQADAQNLLDRSQTQLARSADTAIELVDHTGSQLEQSLSATAPAETAPAQSANLREAAETQSSSAAALEQLASIFADLETVTPEAASKQWADTLAKLTQLAQQSTELRKIDAADADAADVDREPPSSAQTEPGEPDSYTQAEELAKLAEQDPQTVLEQLERELATNEPMSQEMSAIARQVAEQSLGELEQAAEQQQALTNAIELSDPNFKAQKELLHHDLQITGQGVRQLLDTIFSQAKWTTATSKKENEEMRLAGIERQLRMSLERMQQLTLEHTFEQLREVALELQTQLTAAQREIQSTSGELAKASFEEFHQSGADLANRRREMRDRQRRVQQENARDAQSIERIEQQRLRQAENDVRQALQSVQHSAKQLQTARQQLEKKPDQKWLSEQVANLELQLEIERRRQAAIKKLQDAIAQRVESAHTMVEAVNSQQPAPLDSVNPTAQLAAQLSKQAAEMSRRWAEKLETWGTSQLAQAQATASELARDEEQQQQIGSKVAGAANSLSRAARHEARLDNAATSEQLNQAAVATRQMVDRELQQALQQIANARAHALGNAADAVQASPEATQAALGSSRSAEAAIEYSANSLRQMLAGQSESPAAASNAPTSNNSGTPGKEKPSPLDAADKARLLDELDQQVNGELNLGEKEDDSQPAPSSDSPSDSPPSTLADAASQLAQSMSQSRQPPTPSTATADLGSATESLIANAQPQSPVAVRVVEVNRRGGKWGELREQTTAELMETRRETIAPRFRKQVEAYFRELAERGAAGAQPKSSMNERHE